MGTVVVLRMAAVGPGLGSEGRGGEGGKGGDGEEEEREETERERDG